MDEILASIRRILAEDDNVVAPLSTRSRNNADILDLTEAINEDGTVRHITPIAMVSPEISRPRLPDGRIEPTAPRPADASDDPRLVSAAASQAVAASFAQLADLSRRADGHRPLDDVVCETLRPLLQAWLDEHLPPLVERLVREEIARVVGAGGSSAR